MEMRLPSKPRHPITMSVPHPQGSRPAPAPWRCSCPASQGTLSRCLCHTLKKAGQRLLHGDAAAQQAKAPHYDACASPSKKQANACSSECTSTSVSPRTNVTSRSSRICRVSGAPGVGDSRSYSVCRGRQLSELQAHQLCMQCVWLLAMLVVQVC